jgi:hypothetical protein
MCHHPKRERQTEADGSDLLYHRWERGETANRKREKERERLLDVYTSSFSRVWWQPHKK